MNRRNGLLYAAVVNGAPSDSESDDDDVEQQNGEFNVAAGDGPLNESGESESNDEVGVLENGLSPAGDAPLNEFGEESDISEGDFMPEENNGILYVDEIPQHESDESTISESDLLNGHHEELPVVEDSNPQNAQAVASVMYRQDGQLYVSPSRHVQGDLVDQLNEELAAAEVADDEEESEESEISEYDITDGQYEELYTAAAGIPRHQSGESEISEHDVVGEQIEQLPAAVDDTVQEQSGESEMYEHDVIDEQNEELPEATEEAGVSGYVQNEQVPAAAEGDTAPEEAEDFDDSSSSSDSPNPGAPLTRQQSRTAVSHPLQLNYKSRIERRAIRAIGLYTATGDLNSDAIRRLQAVRPPPPNDSRIKPFRTKRSDNDPRNSRKPDGDQ